VRRDEWAGIGMSDPYLRLSAPRPVARADRPALPVGRQLVNAGVIEQDALLKALNLQHYIDAPLGEILVANGDVGRVDVMSALSVQYGAEQVDLAVDPPLSAMAQAIPALTCQKYGAAPWRWFGRTLLVATDRPDKLGALRDTMGADAPRILPVIADRSQVIQAISDLHGPALAARALTRVPATLSSRAWSLKRTWAVAAFCGCALTLGALLSPGLTLTGLVLLSVLTLMLTTGLKATALLAQLMGGIPAQTTPLRPMPLSKMPRISVLVPLFREEDIAQALLKRLQKLTYPKALVEVVLVLEAKDHVTRDTLARCDLPHWIRVIEVPDDGTVTTKPRALNYALDFCQGSIIGIWDAEDAPEADQLEKVAARFAMAGPKVACLQGILDYYNARQNWMARAFTIEYAAWWRLILPGVARLGLALPLGGTTLFFRRDILERLGGWDAHNVTEDAELGIRLHRFGYRTELLDTTTFEEANSAIWPWIKQRTRWLKGYAITWATIMRNPAQLWRDLGGRRFIGLQAQFAGTILGFVTAPLLWTLPLVPLGSLSFVTPELILAGVTLFIAALVATLWINWAACAPPHLKHQRRYIPTMILYYPLASAAAILALIDLAVRPFYWAKTQHGCYGDVGGSETASSLSRTSNARLK